MPSMSIYNKCNNNCIMCTNEKSCRNISERFFSLSYLFKRIERFYQGSNEFLEDYRDVFSLSGGEPTLHPKLIDIIKKINVYFPGIRINLLTNGRMFSYENYAKSFLKWNINLELSISIHGHKADIHDKITQTKNSFREVIRGLENIIIFKKPSQIIEIRVVIHQLNYKFLDEIIKFIKHNFPQVDRVVFIFFEIEGQAINNFEILKLTYAQLFPYINKIYELIRYLSEVRFYHFPLCILPPKFFPYIWRTLPDYEVSFLKSCRNCNFKKFCLGVHRGYLKYIGEGEFKPIKRKINFQEGLNWYHPVLKVNS